MINRSAETVYRVYRYLETSASITDYQNHYTRNKQRCGRKRTQCLQLSSLISRPKSPKGGPLTPLLAVPSAQLAVIGGPFTGCLNEGSLASMFVPYPCEVSAIRMAMLSAAERLVNWGEVFMNARKTFRTMPLNLGTLKLIPSKAESIKGAVMTLTERQSKVEIVLNVHEKTADAINQHLSRWLRKFPHHFFKSITFDNGKEFAGWRDIANQFDIHTYFAEVGAPNQRGLNENNNGLLRRDGLTKQLDFRNLPDELVTQLMSKRNNLPRKSLNYRTPYEVFMEHVTDEQLLFFLT